MNPSITTPSPESDSNWIHLAPHLDDAMQQLSDTDRLAILLRYFQNQPLREVGLALGLEEDAARKRVSRALDKLRDWFSEKGLVSTSVGLAGVISANAIQAAPIGVADVLIKASLVVGAATIGTNAISTTTFMTTTKTILATAAVVATALTIPLLSQRRENEDRQRQIRSTSNEIAQLNTQNAALTAAQISAEELARLRANQAELLRLRGEVGRLRRDLQAKLAAPRTAPTNSTAMAASDENATSEPKAPFTANANVRIPLGSTFVTGGWETSPGKRTLVFVTPTVDSSNGSIQIMFEAKFAEVPLDSLSELGMNTFAGAETTESSLKAMLTGNQFKVWIKYFEQRTGVDLLTAPKIITANERQAQIVVGDEGQIPPTFSVDLLPKFTAGQDAMDLSLAVNMQPLHPNSGNQRPKPR